MAFELPDLATKDYQSLRTELINAIPQLTNQWTNFNTADPGITLLELLCWINTGLLYQVNRIPEQAHLNFLYWVAGAAGNQIDELLQDPAIDQDYRDFLQYVKEVSKRTQLDDTELQRALLSFFNAPYLAVTEQDFILLAWQANTKLKPKDTQLGRVIVQAKPDEVKLILVADQKLSYSYPAYPNDEYNSTSYTKRLTVIGTTPAGDPYPLLVQTVSDYLAPRTLLGSIVNVQKALFTKLNIRLKLRCTQETDLRLVLAQLAQTLMAYLAPLTGGIAKAGWVYDQPPLTSELYMLALKTAGVSQVEDIQLNFDPTLQLGEMAALGVNALLADLPVGFINPVFRGLPLLRCLDIIARYD
jgi:hypothetical protein